MDNIDNMNDYGTTQHERSGTASAAHDKGTGVRTYRPSRPAIGGSHKGFRDSSPEEIQQFVSEKVAKAVAAAAGAVEGFANQMKESRIAENTRQAITCVGETASTIVGTTRKQLHNTKEALHGDLESLGDGSEGSSYGGSGASYQDDTASSSGREMSSGVGMHGSGGGSGKGGGGKGSGGSGKGNAGSTGTGKKSGAGNMDRGVGF